MAGQSSLRISTAENNKDASIVPLITEYRSLTPTTVQKLLIKRSPDCSECGPWSQKIFAAVVLADISGFTKLASTLSVEELKYHINHFFTYLLGKFKQHGGDVVKFCGDAVLVVWTAPINTDKSARQHVVYKATKCVSDMLNDTCGQYEEVVGGHTIRLRLHCGMSAGELHCMSLGNENRMEFLIAGPQLRELSTAESAAKTGELCLSKTAYEYVKHTCTGQVLAKGAFRVTSVHKSHKILGADSPKTRNLSLVTTAMQFVQTLETISPSRRSAKVFFDSEGDSSGCEGSADSFGTTPSSISTAFSFIIGGQTPSPPTPDKFTVAASDLIDNNHTNTASTKSVASDISTDGTSRLDSVSRKLFPENNAYKRRNSDAVFKFEDKLSEEEDSCRTHALHMETCSDSESCRMQNMDYRPSGSHIVKLNPSHADEYQKMLERFVHESARGAIVHNTSSHLAELRVVVTLFIQIMNLDDEFDRGEVERPQQALIEILEVLQKLGGALRQYVVDDKGCVVICSFGVPGFSSLSDDLRGVYASVLIRDKLLGHNIICRIGVSKGMVYCGYVGSNSRKEYCMMGSSVNLAARLMGLCRDNQIIVSSDVYLGVNSDFIFDKLPKLNAKGYDAPVQVYSLQHLRKNPTAYMTVDEVVALLSTGRRGGCFVGRDEEMAILQNSFSLYINSIENSDTQDCCVIEQCFPVSSHSCKNIYPSNKFIILGGKGTGKTKVITEFLQRNEQVIQFLFVVSCHLANVLEPYETSRQLLKALFDTKTSPLGRVESAVDLDTTQDSNCDLVLDEDQRFELLYDRIYVWVQNNLSNVTFDCGGMTTTEDTLEDFEPVDGFSSVANSMRSFVCQSHSGFTKLSSSDNDTSPPEGDTVFNIMEVLPLLRIALDTKTRPDVELVATVTSERIPALLEIMIVEIVSGFGKQCSLGALVIEELQWADKPSFHIIKRILDTSDTLFFVGSMRPFIPLGRKPHHMRAESFEGSVVLNTVEELDNLCEVINLKPISAADIKIIIENVLGPVLLQCMPNAVSDAFVSNVYHKSAKGIVGMVMRQVKELEASVARSNFSATGETQKNAVDGTALEQFDSMNYDNQVVLKVAAVCGTIFTRNLLQQTLERMGYIDTARYLDQALSEIEDRGLIQRVAGADYYKDGTFRLSSLRRRRTEMGSNKTYAFSDRRYSDSVYNIMLEKQRESAHTIVATILAESLDMRSPTCNVVELLAFHYSRANDVAKEIMYTELAAASTKQENMHSASYNYYHHLVTLASKGQTIDEIMCSCYPKSIRRKYNRKTRRPKIHFDNLLASEKYLAPTDLKRNFHSAQPFISDIQLYCIIAEMSILKYKMCDFRESFNMALLCLHGLNLCTTMPKVIVKFSTRLLKMPGKTAFGAMLYYQAQSLMMRGKVGEALKFASTSSFLVHKSDLNMTSSVMALLSTLHYVKKHSRKSNRLLAKCSILTPRSKCALGSANLNFHLGIRQAAMGAIESALEHLNCALTGSVIRKDSSPLKYMVWNMSAWLCFFSGNVSEAENILHSVDRSHREHKTMSMWTSLFTVVVCVFRGEWNQMQKLLANLDTLQKGGSGHLYTTCLWGLLGVCRRDYLSSTASTRDHCVETVIFSATKLAQYEQVTPIGIFSLFISTYCALKLVIVFDSIMGCRPGGGLLHRLRKCSSNGVKAVCQLSRTFPVLSLLTEALNMKLAVAEDKHASHGSLPAICLGLFPEEYSSFTLGLAFWHLERSKYFDYFSFGETEKKRSRVKALECFKKFNTRTDHPLLSDT